MDAVVAMAGKALRFSPAGCYLAVHGPHSIVSRNDLPALRIRKGNRGAEKDAVDFDNA